MILTPKLKIHLEIVWTTVPQIVSLPGHWGML